ncbi:methyl-accepting chemotaxis protein [Ferviditalea candida]|uniref:Methyl-accepting chemotaxis protein n=1 Tax=Ferviditalea candida TaxID=3108399 RepID=A0ABU5ZE76_9BACL|nr:methyl-accepting chemotaxis protein [Paenibacillaceae bacterium T2]
MKSIKTKIMVLVSLILISVLLIQGMMSLYMTKSEIEKQVKGTMSLQANQISQLLNGMEYNTKLLKEQMMSGYDNSIKNQMDVVISILNYYYNKSKNQGLSEAQAQQEAIALLRELKYGKNGYFWMDNTNYKLLLLPPTPEKEGMDRENLTDQTGNKFIKQMVDGAMKSDDSFVNYYFPKPDDPSKAYPKRGHTRLFKPWQWVPGTGNYIDNIDNEMKKYEEAMNADFQKKIMELSVNGSVSVVSAEGTILHNTNKELVGQKIKVKDTRTGEDVIQKIISTKDDFIQYSTQDPESGQIQDFIAYVKFEPEYNRYIAVAKDKDFIFAGTDAITKQFIMLLIAATLLTLLVVYWFAHRFTKPIATATDILQRVASGDLRVDELKVKNKDEIGTLVNHLNQMVQNLRALIGTIMASAQNVAAASQQISASTEEIAGSSTNQAAATQTMTELFKELSIAINTVAVSAEEAANLSNQAVNIAQEGGQVVHQSINGMKAVNEQISKLEEDSNKIGDIIEVIGDIAEQTNLLALNAAIEAARAGEQGRGFAVVADEVRKLAERAGEATKQITQIIKGMQSNTSQSVKAVVDGVAKSEKTGEAFERIIAMVNDTSFKVNEIAAAGEEQAAQSTEVMNTIGTIAAASEESAAAAEETASTSQSLAHLADELNQSVSVFKIK